MEQAIFISKIENLKYVNSKYTRLYFGNEFCQRLIPRKDGRGRVPALEIMRCSPVIKKLLLEGNTKGIPEYVKKGREFGMQTFNQALLELFQGGMVSYDDALQNATNREEFRLNAQGMYTGTDALRAMKTGEPF